METPISPEQKKEIDKLFAEVESSKNQTTSFKDTLKDTKEVSDRIRKDYDDQTRMQKEQDILIKITDDFSNKLHELVNISFPKTLFTESEMEQIFNSKDKEALEYLTHKIATI